MEKKILAILHDHSLPATVKNEKIEELINPTIRRGDKFVFYDAATDENVSYIVTHLEGRLYNVNIKTGNAFPIRQVYVRDFFNAYPNCRSHTPRD